MKLLASLFLFFPLVVFSQSNETKHCGTDEMHQELFLKHPEYNAGIIRAANRSEQFRNSFVPSRENRSTPYIIPVVFHVIHNYGVENISDAQIQDAIAVFNRNFRKLNPDTVDIIPAFQSIAADCEIELRLAQLDPNGNCTSGINRIASPLTFTGDHQVKSLIHWDPSKYLNVYVVDNAAGLAGHALVPSAADTIAQWDGIVMAHNSVGSIGTANVTRSVVLSHEVGHYLSLEHIWGGNNVPNYYYLPCADAGNCAFDDGVADTPNTIGWQTCNLSGASCGNLVDNVQNFMDYAYCPKMFTEGQKTRMHACLNDTIANRNNLWQTANLIATGTDGTNYLCGADFSADRTIICEGETVTFNDNSYHGVTQRNWTFTGGTASSTTDSVVTVTYNTAGVYDVSIIAGNGTGTVNETKTNYITVVPALGIPAPIMEGFESATTIPNTDWLVGNPQGDAGFEITTNAASSGSKSVFIDLNNVPEGYVDELYSRTFDASGLSEVRISFRYAFNNKDTVANANVLKIYVSNDCGNSWVLRKQIGSSTINSAVPGSSVGLYIPSPLDWKTATVSNITNSYLVDDFRVRFSYENVDGNALYMDDINISPTASISEEKALGFTVFPNPSAGNFTVTADKNDNYQYIITDIKGQLIAAGTKYFALGNNELELDFLMNGMYHLTLKNKDGFMSTQQLVIIK